MLQYVNITIPALQSQMMAFLPLQEQYAPRYVDTVEELLRELENLNV